MQKHPPCARPAPRVTIPQFSFVLFSGLGGPQVGLGADAEISLKPLLTNPPNLEYSLAYKLSTFGSLPLDFCQIKTHRRGCIALAATQGQGLEKSLPNGAAPTEPQAGSPKTHCPGGRC